MEDNTSIIISMASVVITGFSLIVSIIVGYMTAKLNSETQSLKLRKMIVDANDTILASERLDDELSRTRFNAEIEKLLNAYEIICYMQRRKINSEQFRILYGNEMKQIIDNEIVHKRLNDKHEAYPHIKRALKILRQDNYPHCVIPQITIGR